MRLESEPIRKPEYFQGKQLRLNGVHHFKNWLLPLRTEAKERLGGELYDLLARKELGIIADGRLNIKELRDLLGESESMGRGIITMVAQNSGFKLRTTPNFDLRSCSDNLYDAIYGRSVETGFQPKYGEHEEVVPELLATLQQKDADVQQFNRIREKIKREIRTVGTIDFSGLTFSRKRLDGINFSGMNLCAVDLRRSWLTKADFSGANLSGGSLLKAVFIGASFVEANLSGADLSGAFFRGADLRGADLTGAQMREANLLGAKFLIEDKEVICDEALLPSIMYYLTQVFDDISF